MEREVFFAEEFEIAEDVREALAQGAPVVALETALVTHGLPYPHNVNIAREMETIIREEGAVPATVALMDGRVRVGLTDAMLERLAQADDATKVSLNNLGITLARGEVGGTTVAATMWVADQVGIRVFATGGTGGVHPGRVDVSADLPALATLQVAVVCAGVKSLLDVVATREWLETYGVPILGVGTDELPGFYTRSAGVPVDARVETPEDAARFVYEHWHVGMRGGVLVTVPLPEQDALTDEEIDAAVREAEEEARARGVRGPDVTPYVLAALARVTRGRSVRANLALLRQNARVAARLAVELANLGA